MGFEGDQDAKMWLQKGHAKIKPFPREHATGYPYFVMYEQTASTQSSQLFNWLHS